MLINPYDGAGRFEGSWFRCNFHTHAGTGPGTCGSHGLREVIEAYEECKYDALMISNHDIYTDTRGMSRLGMIQGVEFSTHPHMLTVGSPRAHAGPHQAVIDAAREDGGFVILCHPNWMRKNYLEQGFLEALRGYRGLEILNTVIYRLTGSGYACDVWDSLLSRGKKAYGFGNDDFHILYDLGRSWNCVYARSTAFEDIKASVENGLFYVSTGLALDSLRLEGGLISAKVRYPTPTHVDAFEYRFIGRDGEVLKRQTGARAEYRLKGDELYVRLEAVSEEGFKLFSQPLYEEDAFVDP